MFFGSLHFFLIFLNFRKKLKVFDSTILLEIFLRRRAFLSRCIRSDFECVIFSSYVRKYLNTPADNTKTSTPFKRISARSCQSIPTQSQPPVPTRLRIISYILGTSSTDRQRTAANTTNEENHLTYQSSV